MQIFKKTLKYFFYFFIGSFIALLVLPFVFKGKLLTFLKEDINKNLHATVNFYDADLSFIRSFPDVRVTIDSLSVTGIDDFEGIELYKADRTSIDVSLSSIFGDNTIPVINNIALSRPTINVVVLDSLRSNYLISKDTSSEVTSYELRLDQYSIENGTLTYQDNTMDLFMVLKGVNHSGAGDLTQDIFDLTTKTNVESLSVKYEGMQYLNNIKTSLDAKINIDFLQSKYTLLDNVIKLNELDVTGDGFVQLQGDDIITKVTFKTASEDFKSFLSMMPNAYTKDFASVKTNGTASISGMVDGTYNGLKNIMPAFDIQIKINKGYVKYPALPQDIKDIHVDMQIKASKPDYRDLLVNIPSFSLKVGNDPISGKILVTQATGNQHIEGYLKSKLQLKNLSQAYPIEGIEELAGLISCDIDFKARMSDINTENYQAIIFKGNMDASNIIYRSQGMPAVRVESATASISPKSMNISGKNMVLGKSDLSMNVNISNPLAMFSTEKAMKIDVTGYSSLLDLNEWMTETTPSSSTPSTEMAPLSIDEDILKNSSIHMNVKMNKVLMNQFTLTNTVLDGDLAANAMKVNKLAAEMDGNDFNISGVLMNAYDYLFNNGTLDGQIDFLSNKLDANQFLVSAPATNATEPVTVIPVPERVRLNINSEIKDLTYTNLNLKNFRGTLEVKDQVVALRDMTTQTLGGTIALEGLYDTNDLSKPDFSVKLDLSKIKFAEAISKIEMLRKAAPIAAYIDGFFNTTLVMKGKLGAEMTPDLATLDASGFLETLSGSLKGFNPLGELADKLGLQELKEVNLANTKNWFEIVQGFIELKEYNKVIKGVDMTISGKHGFGKDMNYNIDLVIPRELLKKNKVTGSLETGLSVMEKEASKLGINISQGPNLFVNVIMTGNIKKPAFKITPKTSKGATVQDAVTSKVNETVTTVKDSIEREIRKKEAELKDTITKRANEELDKLKSKADEAANKALDSIKSKARDVVLNQLDTITKGVIPDSLKQKAKDILDKNSKEEVDKIKDKLKDFNPFKKKQKG
ncbi:MAG: AsmA-like C-terminal region-containing protein [Saprospiraceae bacterium]